MDSDAACSEVSQRNILRRAACLPSLDVEAETAKILRRERARIWAEAMDRHRDEWDQLRVAVVTEYRQRTGSVPSTGFGWMGLNRRAYEQFAAYLRCAGYAPP